MNIIILLVYTELLNENNQQLSLPLPLSEFNWNLS